MTTYKGKLRSKDEEITCECEGHNIERQLSDYQKFIADCMHRKGGYGGGFGGMNQKERFGKAMKSCTDEWNASNRTS